MDTNPFNDTDERYATETYELEPETGFQTSDYDYGDYGTADGNTELIQQYQRMLDNPVVDEPLEELLESRIEQLEG